MPALAMTDPLRLVFGILLTALIGLGSAWYFVRSATSLDTIQVGQWRAWPNAGTDAWDPYSRANMARAGELPLGAGEGLTFSTRHSDDGAELRSNCAYEIVGQTPPARLWTLELAGMPAPGAEAGDIRRAIGSDAIVRRPDDRFTIAVGPRPSTGSWLNSGGLSGLRIILRLYDTAARSAPFISNLELPAVVAKGCQ